jgi:predicted SprT family Zn-dependent metalloprotease
MMVDPHRFELELFDQPEERAEADRAGRSRAVGHFRMAGGRAIIALDQAESADPRVLVAIVAHELCHLRLLGEGRISASRPDGERLTDLAARAEPPRKKPPGKTARAQSRHRHKR